MASKVAEYRVAMAWRIEKSRFYMDAPTRQLQRSLSASCLCAPGVRLNSAFSCGLSHQTLAAVQSKVLPAQTLPSNLAGRDHSVL